MCFLKSPLITHRVRNGIPCESGQNRDWISSVPSSDSWNNTSRDTKMSRRASLF